MIPARNRTSGQFVLLDRDGTINKECHYLSDPDQIRLIPGAAEGLRQLMAMGLGLVVITNQSAIGRGYFDEQRLRLIHERLCSLLSARGVILDGIYFCPHTPDDDCSCRKPRPGLIERAARDFGFDPRQSFVIGDKPCDIELGQRVGATSILVRTGYGAQVESRQEIAVDYIVDDLQAAAGIIRTLVSPDQG
ncbi:MAG: D-glycero-beta-D-manno-heptose 1,7-bisphosphate 7-phosphatase [Thermodesulfobacteriota bacterium]